MTSASTGLSAGRTTGATAIGAIVGGVAIGAALPFVAESPRAGVAALLGAAGVLLSVVRLDVGLVALVALTYANAFVVMTGYGGAPSFALPFVVLLLLFAFFDRALDEPFLPREAEGAVAAFAVYGAWLLASAAWAADPDLTLTALVAHAKRMLVVLAVLVLVRSAHRLLLSVWAVAGTATALAALTIVQEFRAEQTFLGFAGTPVSELTETGDVLRAVGPVGNPNAYAQLLVVAAALAIGLAVAARRARVRALALAMAALIVVVIGLTYSRGGFVGLAVVLTLWFVRYRARLAALVLGAGAILVLAVGLSGTYGSRLSTLSQVLPWNSEPDGDLSLRSREVLLDVGVRVWRDNPAVGVGYANYPATYAEYNREVGLDPNAGYSTHNTPVEILAELGVVGLALWLLLTAAALGTLRRARRVARETTPSLVAVVDALAIAVAGFLATALTRGLSHPMLYWLLLALCFSTAAALHVRRGVRDAREPSARAARPAGAP